MDNCQVLDNQSDWVGGGIYLEQSIADLRNMDISDNYAYAIGGIANFRSILNAANMLLARNYEGAFWSSESKSSLVNTTIAESRFIYLNSSIYADSDSLTLTDCILWDTVSTQVSINGSAEHPSYVEISFSDVKGGTEGISTNEYGFLNWLEGNINEDPFFKEVGAYPFELGDGSPCIDSGNPDTSGMNLPVSDLIGNYRIWDGDNDGDAIVDMGAYEFGSVGVGVESLVDSRQSLVSGQ
jgi:hypothetical protein